MGDGSDDQRQRRDLVLERLTGATPSLRSGLGELDLEELEARRRQLFLVAAFAAFGAAAIAAVTLLWDAVDLPAWVGVALIATTALFFFDATAQERTLRDVTRRAVAERARTRELEQTLGDLAALQAIARRVNAVLLPEEIYEVVIDGAVELLGAVRGSIRLRVDEHLAVAASTGPGSPPIGETVVVRDDLVSPVVSLGLTQRDDDPPRLAVPILVGVRIVGVLEVSREPGDEGFTDRVEVLAQLFADEAATAFVNANRFDHERSRADAAVSVSEQRSDAIADTVHDLRSPLAAIVGFSQLLRDRWDDLDPPRRVELATDIHIQAERLDERIESMFETATAEARAVRVRDEVVLADVAGEAIATVRAAAAREGWDHSIRLDATGDVVVRGDRDALLRVVTNLVANAVEHAGPDVLVRVQRRGSEVRLHVADRGAGLGPSEVTSLFQHRRVDDGRPRGRGLSIVDSLVRAMGGRVGVRSQPGVGTVFSVMLPAPD